MKSRKRVEMIETLKRMLNYADVNANKTFKNLEERNDLILKEWTSSKGIEFVLYNNNGINFQIEKKLVKNHKVCNETNIIY